MAVKVNSREVGLIAGLNLAHYFLGMQDLHYGLWQGDLEVCIQNLPEAQKRYSQFLISHIPAGVRRILDVGCGAGGLAASLIKQGYQVEGVSPSSLLTEAAQKRLGEGFKIHQGRFEELSFASDDYFDLVMFSESLQYILLDEALNKASQRLYPGGYILICDFFKTGAPGKSLIGGGHVLDKFLAMLDQMQLQLELVTDVDITRETAPNLDIFNQMGRELFLPTFGLIDYVLTSNYPLLSRFLHWRYRNKLDRINRKYTSGERDAAHFATHKAYRLFLLRKRGQ